MAKRSRVITMTPLDLNQENDLEIHLDLWEVVNPSDGEYSDDSFSVDSLSDDDVISLDDDSFVSPSVISPPPQTLPQEADDEEIAADLDLNDAPVDDDGDGVFRDDVDDKDLPWSQRRMVVLRGGTPYSVGITYGDYFNRGDGGEDGDYDDDEYDDSYDLDYDDLVPRGASRKVGRQRMRKLGNRAIAKLSSTSKTSPYLHLKHGCVRGKHGLGLKFKY